MSSPATNKAFVSLELLLAVAILGAIVTGVAGWLYVGSESAAVAGLRYRATLIAEEGLEAVRNIRDEDYFDIADGTYGLSDTGGTWSLSGTSDTNGPYTRQITITTTDVTRMRVTSVVTWQQDARRTGSVSLSTELTNWHRSTLAGDNFYIGFLSATVTNKQLQNLKLRNIGGFDITIDKIQIWWRDHGGGNNNSKISEIKFNNTDRIWSKTGPGTPLNAQQSGTLLDVQDYTIVGNGGIYTSNYFKFEGNKVYGLDFSIDFHMTDGSIKHTGWFTPPDR